MDHAHRHMTADKKSRNGAGGGKPAAIPAMSNQDLAEMLLNEAKRVEGASDDQLWMPTHPDEFKFAEDGDDDGPLRRQQELALPGLRPKHEGKEYEDFTNGTAFVQGAGDQSAVDANDVKQGALGDCYLIAGMAGVARADPKLIEDLIKDNGDGTFDVKLYIRPRQYARPEPVVTTVDARLAVKYSGKPLYAGLGDQVDGKDEMWPALIEKALAQNKESYDLISGGNISKNGFFYAGTSELLTGKRGNFLPTDGMDGEEALLWIDLALEDGRPITVSSRNEKDNADLTREANGRNIYWNHAYAPESVDLDAETVNLQNPWGSSHVTDLSGDDFIRFYRAIRIGGGSL